MVAPFDNVTPLLAELLVKGTILLLLGSTVAAVFAWRRASAAQRHLVWTITLGAVLLLPLLAAILPRVSVFSKAPSGSRIVGIMDEQPQAFQGPQFATTVREVMVAQETNVAGVSEPAPIVRAGGGLDLRSCLIVAWGAGVLVSLVWVGAGWVHLRRLRGRCTRLESGQIADRVAHLAQELGISRAVHVLQSADRVMPMTWGVRVPVLLLPVDATGWTLERLDMVILHELGHVKRWDCLTQFVGVAARALFWFHPLAWWAQSRQRLEQEQACDDLVVAHGAAADEYAEHLLSVTARLPVGYFAPPLALGMARTTRMRARLIAILDGSRDRRPPRRMGMLAWSGAGLAALVLLVLFGLQAVAAPAQSPQLIDDKSPVAEEGKEKDKKDGSAAQLLQDVQKKLREHYVGPLDEKQLHRAAIQGLVKGLQDPYTSYLPAEELQGFESQVQGEFAGIGAQLKMEDQDLVVVTPLDQSPAFKAGLRPGDRIAAIDGKPTRGSTAQAAVKQILGKPGTQVKLKVIHHDGVVEELAITRAQVRVGSVEGFRRDAEGRWSFTLDDEQKIGYVRVLQFSGNTSQSVREAVKGLKDSGLKALILDLRSCPGGLLSEALKTCELFLPKGTIVSVRGANKEERKFDSDGKSVLGDFPMVVLINEQTASAAEIVAGALRDHERAVLVGTRTFGKGSVQAIVKLEDGGALRVTTAYHYLPSGRNIQKRPGEPSWGVDPSDGYYMPLSATQQEAWLRAVQERSILGQKRDDQPKAPGRVTPRQIEERFADPQLAGALKTTVARLTGGEFLKVGKSTESLNQHVLRLEEMRQKREVLLKNLDQIDREIKEIQQAK